MKNLLIALALIAVFAAVQSMPAGKSLYYQNKSKTNFALNLKYCHEISIAHPALIGDHKSFHNLKVWVRGFNRMEFHVGQIFFGADLGNKNFRCLW